MCGHHPEAPTPTVQPPGPAPKANTIAAGPGIPVFKQFAYEFNGDSEEGDSRDEEDEEDEEEVEEEPDEEDIDQYACEDDEGDDEYLPWEPEEDDILEDDGPIIEDENTDSEGTDHDERDIERTDNEGTDSEGTDDEYNESYRVGNKRPRSRQEEQVPRKVRHKRHRPLLHAEQYLASLNKNYPVRDNDPDLLRFQANILELSIRLCNWSCQMTSAWFHLPRKQREMTRQFRSLLSRIRPEDLKDHLLSGIPRLTQKVLGKPDLMPKDLLDLPLVPCNLTHRLVYLDVATRMPNEDVTYGPSALTLRSKNIKRLREGADPFKAAEIKAYVGSSISKQGGRNRLAQHEAAAVNPDSEGTHYSYIKQDDVVPNFRTIGI